MEGFGAFLLLAVLAVIYFLPAAIAGLRNHPQIVPITLLNFFLGWTLLGWVAALVWSSTNFSAQQRG